jgi:hypothetical protein
MALRKFQFVTRRANALIPRPDDESFKERSYSM